MLLLARKFSTDTYGQVVTLFTLSTVFVTILDFGLPIILQREISLNRNNAGLIFSRVFSAGIALFIIYSAFSYLYFRIFYSDIPVLLFFIISISLYISSLVNICNRALSGISSFKKQFISFIIPRILILAFFLAGLYYFDLGLNFLLFGILAGFSINLIFVLINLHKEGITFSGRYFSINSIKIILKASYPLGLAVIFNYLYDKVDVLLISKLTDFSQVAYYNAGYGLFKAATVSFSFILVSGFTKASAISSDKSAVSKFFKEYFKIIITICIFAAIVLYFFSENLINTLYGQRFFKSINVLQILAAGIIAVGLNNLTGVILNGMGYYKIVMYITLYALVMNVLLNILFIPGYGILASSIITLITEYFIFILEYYYLNKILNSK